MAELVQVTVNGEPRELAAGSTVQDLVGSLGLVATQVAVERNKQIVRRADYSSTPLESGDRVEIVTFFGGG